MAAFVADPSMTLAEGRDQYFKHNNFGPNGGYDEPWVDFKFGPIPMPIPNTKGRVRAVRYHDLHHVLTGYATDTLGEFEISAWEIGSGCKDFITAWQLNLSGLFGGVLLTPRKTWRAFVRGRHSRNLYGTPYDEVLLKERVDEVRSRLGLQETASATASDVMVFVAAVGGGFVIGVAMFALMIPIAIVANVAEAFRRPLTGRVA